MAKIAQPSTKPVSPDATDRLMELVKNGFQDRMELERIERAGRPTQPPAVPISVSANSVSKPNLRPKPLPKSKDPDYMGTSTYFLKHLVASTKVVAAQMGVDMADIYNEALSTWLERFDSGFKGRED